MRTRIEIIVKCRKMPVRVSDIRRTALAVLKEEKIKIPILTLCFVSNPAIRHLNRKFLSKNSTTDVLAFDSGDIAVSVDAALISARKLGLSSKEELCRYVIHGMLHLSGYDDISLSKKKKMWKRQEQLLKKLTGNNPSG